PGASSGTIRHSSLPFSSMSLECCTQTTGTCSRRALSTRAPTFATTVSRSWLPSTTPLCTSTTSNAVFGRFCSVVMISCPHAGLRCPSHASRAHRQPRGTEDDGSGPAGQGAAAVVGDHVGERRGEVDGPAGRGAAELGAGAVQVADDALAVR